MMPKVRAWDKKEKKMLYESDITVCDEDGDEHDYVKRFIAVGPYDFFEVISPCIYGGHYPREEDWTRKEGTLLLSTGLKDKNSNEIYAGDIVKGYFVTETGKEHKIGEVIFELAHFAVRYGADKERLPLYIMMEKEVIGNIFQNKELLTGAKKK